MTIDNRAALDRADSEDSRAAHVYDEALSHPVAMAGVLGWLAHTDHDLLRRTVQDDIETAGVRFHSVEGDSAFLVDPVPRVIAGDEWARVAAGCEQRVRALEQFVRDIYGEQRIVAEGIVAPAMLAGADYYEPGLAGLPVSQWIPVAGLDLIRDADGVFHVLEDNVRTPSGLAYAIAVREAVSRRVPVPDGHVLRPLGGAVSLIAEALRRAAPAAVDDPVVVVLTDGPDNCAYYEHEMLARALGLPLVVPAQLRRRDGRLYAPISGRLSPVDVIYRRTNADRMFGADGRPEPLGALLLEPLRAGRLAIVNAFGAGVADNKLVQSQVEDMVRFYLGEEPLIGSVPTYDPSDRPTLEMVLDRLSELVVKPSDGHGGQGVVIGPDASVRELNDLRVALEAEPTAFIAQELVRLSHHPTVCDGALAPRHVDLRAFVFSTPDSAHAVAGGLTRVALEAGSLIVNSSRNGGAKDTWILD